MQFQDLPKGGYNLRLYTYVPTCPPACGPGEAPPNNQWKFNTGHFDIALGVPCSQPDPQGFMSFSDMSAYAAGRGETLVMVSPADLTYLCAYRASAQLTPTGQGTQGPISAGVTSQGVITTATIQPSGNGGIIPPPGYIPPPGTPIQQGGLPSGTVGQTKPGLTALYRFIMYLPGDPAGDWASGANYPGCSQTNTANCRAKAFHTLDDAVRYAEANGEIPYRVDSQAEVWSLIDDRADIDPSKILGKHAVSQPIGMGTLVLIGLGLWFLSGR